MWWILRNTLRRSRGQILGWGISLALLAAYLGAFYDTMVTQREQFQGVVEALPPEMLAFFGGMTNIFEPVGYLTLYFSSYMPIVIGIYAALTGSGLLVNDEERGTMDLVLAHPISRTSLFLGRCLGLVGAMVAILFMTWLGLYLSTVRSTMGLGAGEMALLFVSLGALVALYAALALTLSLVLPSRNLAASVAGLVVVADYMLASLVNLDPGLEAVARFFPLYYFQGAEAIRGLDGRPLGVLLGVTILLGMVAWWRFQQRDIRVGGEGGWRFPSLAMTRRNRAPS